MIGFVDDTIRVMLSFLMQLLIQWMVLPTWLIVMNVL